jgi:radical SAM-linked protein
MVRLLEQAIRRSGISVAYSEGFHPRLKVSFGPPLPFGMTSKSEFIDVILNEDCDVSHATALEKALPDGVNLVEFRGMPATMPSLSESINEQEFSAVLPLEPDAALEWAEALRKAPHVEWKRPDRTERKPVDPRPTLRQLDFVPVPGGVQWAQSVSIGSEGSIRPADWAMLMFGLTAEQIARLVICRTKMICRRGAHAKSPFDIV